MDDNPHSDMDGEENPRDGRFKAILVISAILLFLASVIAVAAILGIAGWQLGIFAPVASQTAPMDGAGFSRLKPQLAATGMSADGKFYGVFINGVGTDINVTRLDIKNTDETHSCEKSSLASPQGRITPGGQFLIEAQDCVSKNHEPGEEYTLKIRITYQANTGGETISHAEEGSITGYYE